MSAEEIKRLPGESLVSFYNRRLKARGIHDREWFIDPLDKMRMRDKPAPKRFDLADPE